MPEPRAIKGEHGSDSVVNPLASSYQTSPKAHRPERPRYETDKIIIPTKLKKISTDSESVATSVQPETNAPIRKVPQPMFSTKDYSLKPGDSSNDIRGILGVEYVIKILKNATDTNPRYECGLCELVLDSFAMQRHLEGHNHRLKFCEKHFPTAMRHYRQYMHNLSEKESLRVMTKVLSKLSIAIERYHGRNLPYECYERDFSLNRHQVLAKAFSCRHPCEQHGPTFTHVIDSKEINQFINERSDNSTPPPNGETVFDSIESVPREDIYKPITSSKYTMDSSLRNRSPLNRPFINAKRKTPELECEYSMGSRFRDRPPFNNPSINYRRNHPDLETMDSRYRSYPSSNNSQNNYRRKTPELEDNHSSRGFKERDQDRDHDRDRGISNTSKSNTLPKHTNYTFNSTNQSRNNSSNKTSAIVDSDCSRSSIPDREISSNAKTLVNRTDDIADIMKMYFETVDKIICDLKEKFDEYRSDPESYPSYNEEWQQFWKRRKNELIAQGIDHRAYNYQAEWIVYIKERLEELFNMEIENLKKETRLSLGLQLPI